MFNLRSSVVAAFAVCSIGICVKASEYKTTENVPYYKKSVRKADPYIKERCKLDIYAPQNKSGFPTVIWFHGG